MKNSNVCQRCGEVHDYVLVCREGPPRIHKSTVIVFLVMTSDEHGTVLLGSLGEMGDQGLWSAGAVLRTDVEHGEPNV